jgi:putative ABC transport system substrate-binding protein
MLWANTPAIFTPWADAFRRGLQEHGYRDGETIRIDLRWADGQVERFPALAHELVALPVDVLITVAEAATRAAAEATTTIPIVFGSSSDPVAAGFVSSFARPDRTITGVSSLGVPLSAKRLELLKTAVPSLTRVGVFGRLPTTTSAHQFQELAQAAPVLGVQLEVAEITALAALDAFLATPPRVAFEALIMLNGAPFIDARRQQFVQFAAAHRLPSMFALREYVEAGGLMSYGVSMAGALRRVAYFVDRLLNGAKPADLPVEQPTVFDFVVNLKTAQGLGLTIPQSILEQATEVMQ